MKNVIVTDPPRAEQADVDALAGFGVATVHEAMGRTGLAGPQFRPDPVRRPGRPAPRSRCCAGPATT